MGYRVNDIQEGKSQGGKWHFGHFGDVCESSEQRRGNETCGLAFLECWKLAPSAAHVGSTVHELLRQFNGIGSGTIVRKWDRFALRFFFTSRAMRL